MGDLPATQDVSAAVIERVVITGDLKDLTPEQRVAYYRKVCDTLGLNPFTRPFSYLMLNNRLQLYASRDATDQLRKKNQVSVTIQDRREDGDIYSVVARATYPDGRTDESLGAVSVKGLQGESRANALMKCETKAKRRVTLSICGLGWLDETEVGSIPNADAVTVDNETGEITGREHPEPPRMTTVALPTQEHPASVQRAPAPARTASPGTMAAGSDAAAPAPGFTPPPREPRMPEVPEQADDGEPATKDDLSSLIILRDSTGHSREFLRDLVTHWFPGEPAATPPTPPTRRMVRVLTAYLGGLVPESEA